MESREEKLLKAIFNGAEDEAEDETEDMPDDNYPETTIEKVGYAELVVTKMLEPLSRAIVRLSRLHRLLMLEEKDPANKLPDIITHNEVRMALEPLLWVETDVKEIAEMLVEIYKATKHDMPKTPDMEAQQKGEQP